MDTRSKWIKSLILDLDTLVRLLPEIGDYDLEKFVTDHDDIQVIGTVRGLVIGIQAAKALLNHAGMLK